MPKGGALPDPKRKKVNIPNLQKWVHARSLNQTHEKISSGKK